MRDMRRTQRWVAGLAGHGPGRGLGLGLELRPGLGVDSEPNQGRVSGRLGGRLGGLLAGLLGLAGCQVAEPYLLPARSVEMLGTLQPDLRPDAQLPAVRERDRAPSLVRRRALGLSEAEFAQATARKTRFYRVRASEKPPMYYVGGVVLGAALPPLLIGLMTGLDPVGNAAPTRGMTDLAGGGVMMALAGLHIGVGGLLLALGDRRPQVETAERGLVQQYVDGTAPLLQNGPPLSKEPEATGDGTAGGASDPSSSPSGGEPGSPAP